MDRHRSTGPPLATGLRQLAYLYQQLDVEQRVRDGRHARRQQQHRGVGVDGPRCGILLGTGYRLGPAVQWLHLQLASAADAGHRRSSVKWGRCRDSFRLRPFRIKLTAAAAELCVG